jgi:hypothetical protein
MNSNSKRLLNHRTAARALPRCVSGFNQHDHTTSIHSFVRGVLNQLTPGSIRNAFCQAMILKHVLDTQIFKSHKSKGVYQFTTFLVSKVPTPIGNALMDGLHCFAPLRSFGRSLLCLREFALCFCKFLFISAQETRIGDSISVREFSKALQTHIYSNCQIIAGHWLRVYLTSETSIPISHRVPLNCEGLDLPFQRAMQNNSHGPDFGQEQTIIKKFKTELLESEAIVPTITPKTWIPRFLSRLHPAKECLESQVNTLLNILQNLRENAFQFRMFLLPEGEHLICIVQRKRFMLLLPGILASGKRLVIDPTAKFQRLNQLRSLAPGWLQAILESFHQRSSAVHLDILLIFEVLLQDGYWRTSNRRNKVRMRPQGRQSTSQLRKLLTKQTRAKTFHSLHEFMHSEL